jgi:hypothetical protein
LRATLTARHFATLCAYNRTNLTTLFRYRFLEIAAMLFILYYVVAIVILVLHFTGMLARYNLEWLVLALAITVFPAVIYL